MGSILIATCPCGYESRPLYSGGGLDPGFESLPGHCAYCRAVVSVRTGKPRLRCPRCGRKPTLYELYDPDGLDERYEDRPWPCPRCNQPTLRFTYGGIWD